MKQVGDELQKDPDFGEKILEPLEIFGVDKFADSAVIMKARFKTLPIQQWSVGREYNRRLKKAFDEKGIEIPFPHTTVYWGEKINPLRMEIEEKLRKGS
jgi:small conductance mechanosensitive channel